jgi:hypothetical protein
MDDWTNASTGEHQYGRVGYTSRRAGKEQHDVDQAK